MVEENAEIKFLSGLLLANHSVCFLLLLFFNTLTEPHIYLCILKYC